jgi:hypothetical protein
LPSPALDDTSLATLRFNRYPTIIDIYLNNVKAWTKRCSTSDTDPDQIRVILGNLDAAGSDSHPPVERVGKHFYKEMKVNRGQLDKKNDWQK